jgi:predicted RNA-binding Zn-ribbon protein involved in translation (DUF1610 family)
VLLIFGIGTKESLLGVPYYICETCGQAAAHRLLKLSRRFTLFFIPLIPLGVRYYDTCTSCARTIELSEQQIEAVTRQTNPELR